MKKNFQKLLAIFLLSILVVASSSIPSVAASVQIISPYPSVSVSAGKTLTFSFKVKTASRQRVDLAVTNSPPGWQTTLRGGGFVVRSVFGAPEEEDAPEVQLEVRVPPDAAKGDYEIVLRGSARGATDTLAFGVQIAEVAEGAVTLTSDFASLKGTAEAPLRYTVVLTNNTPQSTTFDLAATGPEGWNISVRPSGQSQASSVKVDGGQQSNLDVEATPATNTTGGTYEIKVTANGGGQSAEITLQAEITGNVKLALSTPNQRLNTKAVAGRETELTVQVKNDGTSPVENVKLSASTPQGWKVTFRPETIRTIEAKKSANAVAIITPTGDAVAGDYILTLNASATGANADSDIRVTVETSKVWGAIGLLVIAAAIFILLRVFRQYGRR